jgi:hypothetical protein
MIGEMTCTHVWLLDPPDGPTSVGVCKLCGDARDFPNALPEDLWSTGVGAEARGRHQSRRRPKELAVA